MATKVVGFQIEIKGQKDIVNTTKVLGLLNTQLILIGNTLAAIDKQGGVALNKLSKDFKTTGSSAKQLGAVVKTSFKSFEDGNKIVKDLGNGYFEVTKAIDKTSKEFRENEKALESDSDSVKDLIKRNKELKQTLLEQPIGEQTDAIRKLGKEYAKNNDVIKDFRKELRTGKKATEASAGSLDELRAKSIALKKEYNALSGAQQNAFIGDGARIRKSLEKTNKQIQKLDKRVRDGKTSIGLYQNAQKGLTKTLLKLSVGRSVADGVANGLRNMFQGLKDIATGSEEAREKFKGLNAAGAGLQNTLQQVGSKILGAFGGAITKVLDNISFVVSVVADSFISAAEGTGIFATALRFIGSVFTDFPAIIGGVLGVFGEFRDRIVKSATEMSLQFEKVVVSIKRIGTALTGGDTTEINNRLANINKQLADNVVFAKTIGEAYQEGFDATIKAQEEFKKGSEEEVAIEAKRLEAAKRREEQSKEAAKAEKKRIEDLKKDRTDLLKQIESQSLARIQIAVDLDKQLRDLQIKAISDSGAQAIAAEKERFSLESAARKENFEARKAEVEAQEAEIIRLFGIYSDEYAIFITNSENELQNLRLTNDQIAELQAKNHQDALLKIEKDGIAARKAADQKAFRDGINEAEAEYEAEEAAAGAASDRRVAKSIERDKKAEEDRKSRASATKDAIVGLVDAAFSAISDIVNIANQAENERFDRAIEDRQNSISKLNEDLQSATGLQKKFLEKQIEQEQAALDKETEAKEKARKEQAEAQKAIAIVQAVIAAALGIANAFTLPPPASFVAAAATAVATGAQIAVIASQKFAKGGILNGPSHANGGISTPFGELEGGEAVITRAATKKHSALLSAINVDGGGKKFANGGITGAPISAPSVANANTDVNTQFNQFMSATMASTQATNSRIDRLQVVQDLNNLQDIEDNDATLEAITTF